MEVWEGAAALAWLLLWGQGWTGGNAGAYWALWGDPMIPAQQQRCAGLPFSIPGEYSAQFQPGL